jgi:hypothetical protein
MPQSFIQIFPLLLTLFDSNEGTRNLDFWKVIPYHKVVPAKLLRKCRNILSARIQSCRVRWINYKYSIIISFLAAEKLNYCARFSTSTRAKHEYLLLSEEIFKLLEGNKWKLFRRMSKLYIDSGCNLLNCLAISHRIEFRRKRHHKVQ